MGDQYNIFFEHEEIATVLHPGWISEYEYEMQRILNQA